MCLEISILCKALFAVMTHIQLLFHLVKPNVLLQVPNFWEALTAILTKVSLGLIIVVYSFMILETSGIRELHGAVQACKQLAAIVIWDEVRHLKTCCCCVDADLFIPYLKTHNEVH
jgi:hypothetical protein